MNNKDMTLAETLAKARYKKGLAQRDVGELIGKSSMTVSNAERLDGAMLSKEVLADLCRVYDIDYNAMAEMLVSETVARKESRKLATLSRKAKKVKA